MSRTLLDITKDLRVLDELMGDLDGALVQTDGEVTPEIQAMIDAIDSWMAELDADLEGKVDNYAALVTELLARAEVRKAEADRLAKRARIDTDNAKWLKARLLGELQERGLKVVDTPRYRVSVAGNGGKIPLVVTDEARLMADERFVRVERSLDAAAVREALDAGDDLQGAATFGERGSHLRIK